MRVIEGKSVGRFGEKKKRRKKEQSSNVEIVMQIIRKYIKSTEIGRQPNNEYKSIRNFYIDSLKST